MIEIKITQELASDALSDLRILAAALVPPASLAVREQALDIAFAKEFIEPTTAPSVETTAPTEAPSPTPAPRKGKAAKAAAPAPTEPPATEAPIEGYVLYSPEGQTEDIFDTAIQWSAAMQDMVEGAANLAELNALATANKPTIARINGEMDGLLTGLEDAYKFRKEQLTPKPTEAPAATQAPAVEISVEQCREALQSVATLVGFDEARQVILPFAPKVSEIAVEKRRTFFDACKAKVFADGVTIPSDKQAAVTALFGAA